VTFQTVSETFCALPWQSIVGGTWIWLTAGTAFAPEDLDALKIPLSVR